jgi:hypothetical protein
MNSLLRLAVSSRRGSNQGLQFAASGLPDRIAIDVRVVFVKQMLGRNPAGIEVLDGNSTQLR